MEARTPEGKRRAEGETRDRDRERGGETWEGEIRRQSAARGVCGVAAAAAVAAAGKKRWPSVGERERKEWEAEGRKKGEDEEGGGGVGKEVLLQD